MREGQGGDGGAAGSRPRALEALHYGPPPRCMLHDRWVAVREPCACPWCLPQHPASARFGKPRERSNGRKAARAPTDGAREHANDASVGLFRVYNSSCVTACMIVSLVSLILSHSSSSARDWNRFQAVLDEPATGLGASAVWSAPTAGRRYPTLALSHHPLVTKSRRPPPRHMSARVLRAGQHAARSRIALRVV